LEYITKIDRSESNKEYIIRIANKNYCVIESRGRNIIYTYNGINIDTDFKIYCTNPRSFPTILLAVQLVKFIREGGVMTKTYDPKDFVVTVTTSGGKKIIIDPINEEPKFIEIILEELLEEKINNG
jgi:hypothetical protein